MNCGRFPSINVTVPGGLLAGATTADFRRFESVGLRPLTGYEEDWLAANRGKPGALLASGLLDACVTSLDGEAPPQNTASRLLAADREYLVFQLRRLTLGDAIHAIAACPECGRKMDVTFNAAEVPVERRPQSDPVHALALADGRIARFRLPVGADQESIAGMESQAAADHLFDACLLDDGGRPLTEDEKARVIEAMGEVAPGIDLDLELECPECARQFVLPFDTTSFFFDEMRIQEKQLLREVHALALYYHWSERDILSLERDRRRRYLALLREATREA
jgi:hypothetical protein